VPELAKIVEDLFELVHVVATRAKLPAAASKPSAPIQSWARRRTSSPVRAGSLVADPRSCYRRAQVGLLLDGGRRPPLSPTARALSNAPALPLINSARSSDD
jgi:hypothetical protein